MSGITRREFMKQAGIAAAATQLYSCATPVVHSAEPVRVGVIGIGARGGTLLEILLSMPGVEIPAVCDINPDHLLRGQNMVADAGQPFPEGYSRGPWDFQRLTERPDLDAVIAATPWDWHTPMALAAMRAGKYAGIEVPCCTTLDEAWELVETCESTGVPLMMLENVCYFRDVMMVLNMVQHSLFGEMLHCEAGYQHDVRYVKFDDQGNLRWRGEQSVTRNGNLYPTHAIGPVSWWLGINRGDRFTRLVSMSTKSRGLNLEIEREFGPDHPNAKRTYALGDINTSLIRTAGGCTVTLYHDTQSYRPYDLIFRVQGTDGIYSGTLNKIYINGRSPEDEQWEDIGPYRKEFEHPLWRQLGQMPEESRGFGHGGGDWLTINQFLHAVRTRTGTPQDVYDAVTWSAIAPLTERSVAEGSMPVEVPDFTRGKWMEPRPLEFAEL